MGLKIVFAFPCPYSCRRMVEHERTNVCLVAGVRTVIDVPIVPRYDKLLGVYIKHISKEQVNENAAAAREFKKR
jgi:hypothetical protein